MIVEVACTDDRFKQFKKFCNSLRCPLCKAQLDGSIFKDKARLYCVTNNDEYKLECVSDESITSEDITYWYSEYMYTISIRRQSPGSYRTIITRFETDAIPAYRYKTAVKVFENTGDRILFFRTRMEEDVFLRKLKTYNIFS